MTLATSGGWVDACAVAELEDGAVTPIRVRGRDLGAARIGERVYVFAARCPHHGGPLAHGRLTYPLASTCPGELSVERDAPAVSCPWHGWEFRLETGRAVADESVRVKVFTASVHDGRVLVALEGGGQRAGA
jgi:nitrite reductase/ring-hydroxylating ferredoxin subunit